ncbi:transporter substrate-binding domain-containing protein [Planctomycetota bacterium]|nr:transporter substrate-binding domain-containing protein [Planctomycetota bacterium]
MPRSLLLCAKLVSIALVFAGCSLFVRPDPGAEPPDVDPGQEQEISAASVDPIDSDSVAPGADTAYWDLIRAGGPLKVGINASYPPFAVKIAEGWTGFDVDLAAHLGETLGVEVELVPIRTAQAVGALDAGDIDIAIAGMTRTAQRSAGANFTRGYLLVSQAALVESRLAEGSRGTDEEIRRDHITSYLDLNDITGIRVGVARNTRPHRQALALIPNAHLVLYDTIQDASDALIAGNLNAIVHDDPYVRSWKLSHPQYAGSYTELVTPVTEEPIAMAIRKGDLEFLNWLNDYVFDVRHDGTVDQLYRRHFIEAKWVSEQSEQ